jgi:hypothetical protein
MKHDGSDAKWRQPVWRTRVGTSAQVELDRSAGMEPREWSIRSSRSSQSIGTSSITVIAAGAATASASLARSAAGSASMTTTSREGQVSMISYGSVRVTMRPSKLSRPHR